MEQAILVCCFQAQAQLPQDWFRLRRTERPLPSDAVGERFSFDVLHAQEVDRAMIGLRRMEFIDPTDIVMGDSHGRSGFGRQSPLKTRFCTLESAPLIVSFVDSLVDGSYRNLALVTVYVETGGHQVG